MAGRRSGEAQAALGRKAGPMRHRLSPRGGSRNEFQEYLEELEPEQENSMRARRFLADEALRRFPEACAALIEDSMRVVSMSQDEAHASLNDLVFWTDSKGRLHCDDRIHPAFDDMWEDGKWVGSDEGEEE